MVYVYSIQRQIMRRNSFGHYFPIGEWEDLEQYQDLDVAIQRMGALRRQLHFTILNEYCFRVLQKGIDK